MTHVQNISVLNIRGKQITVMTNWKTKCIFPFLPLYNVAIFYENLPVFDDTPLPVENGCKCTKILLEATSILKKRIPAHVDF